MADRPPPPGRLILRHAALLLAVALACADPASAVQPDEVLPDHKLEARAREIGRDLRCLVCQNQSIDDSDADLARDLRVLVRERLKAGDSDRQVVDYIVSRYGDFVLLRPPLKPATYALWFGPGVILVGGAVALALYLRRRSRRAETAAAPLDEEDEHRLARLLKDAGE